MLLAVALSITVIMTDNFWFRAAGLLAVLISACLSGWLTRGRPNLHARESPNAVGDDSGEEQFPLSDASFRRLVENLPTFAVVLLDPKGRIVSWTGTAKRITGYQGSQVVGRALVELLSAEPLPQPESWFKAARQETTCEQRVRCVRQDGSQFWAQLVISIVPHVRSIDPAYAVVLRDISEQTRSEEEHMRRAQELSEASRMKDEFLATMSHELRTPLNSILGWAQLLRRGKLDQDGRGHAVETIEHCALTQARLIEDLLDISRIVSGKMRLDIRAVQPIDVIEAAIETVRPAAEAKAISIQSLLDPVNTPLLGDPNRLQQIVWNLLSNAIKFTPRHGVVRVQFQRAHSHVEIIVKDSGVGIDASFLPFIFDAFRQADSSSTRSHTGLGLGLAIVRHLAELHGGDVRVTSDGEGQGATFTVRLPVAPIYTATRASAYGPWEASHDAHTQSLAALRGKRAVVVDDDPTTRQLLMTALRQYGVDVTATESASQALTAVQTLRPDVLLSDVEMPGEDGYSLIRKIRALDDEHGGRIPALALTAYARPEDHQRALSAGFQLHLSKPVEPEQLALAIQSLIRVAQEQE